MTLHGVANAAAQDALRILTVLDVRVAAMRDAMQGQPGAQRFGDVRSSGRTVLWCWEHQQEARDCEQAGEDGTLCDMETIDVPDPTGEAALSPDRARDDLNELEKQLKAAARALNRAFGVLGSWGDNVPVNDKAGIGECMDCKRYADGRKLRLSTYKTTGEPVCPSCRARRDRRVSA